MVCPCMDRSVGGTFGTGRSASCLIELGFLSESSIRCASEAVFVFSEHSEDLLNVHRPRDQESENCMVSLE